MVKRPEKGSHMDKARPRRSSNLLGGVFILALVVASLGLVGGTTASAQAASKCTGSASANLGEARSFFEQYCGGNYWTHRSEFRCDYQNGTFKCSGPRGEHYDKSTCVGISIEVRPDGRIQRNWLNYSGAKSQFRHVCQEEWEKSSGAHGCTWNKYSGWLCWVKR